MKQTTSFSSVLWWKTYLGPVRKESHAMFIVRALTAGMEKKNTLQILRLQITASIHVLSGLS